MALSSPLGHRIVSSPDTHVHWAGWRASARTLQRHGWEFAVQEDYASMTSDIAVVMRHESGAMAFGRVPFGAVLDAATRYVDAPPVIIIDRMAMDDRMVFVQHSTPLSLSPVSMEPSFVERVELRGSTLDVFSKPATKELIVAPESVSELFERIKKLQAPELQAIRERNRLREAREQREIGRETVVAKVISLAA